MRAKSGTGVLTVARRGLATISADVRGLSGLSARRVVSLSLTASAAPAISAHAIVATARFSLIDFILQSPFRCSVICLSHPARPACASPAQPTATRNLFRAYAVREGQYYQNASSLAT